MYEHAVSEKIKDLKFNAILHGADPKSFDTDGTSEKIERKENLVFGDPKDYEKLSDEEKKILSDKMSKKFMKWAGAKKDG